MGKKGLIFFITLVFVTISLGCFFWVREINNNNLTFSASGYVIAKKQGKDLEDMTTRYYFNAGDIYKKTVNNTITFKDSEKDSVVINRDSFLHFNDESIGVLKKAVILNLDFIKNDSIIYYNLLENAVLKKQDINYYIEHLNGSLKFEYFVIKISDSKYLVYSPKMNLKIEDEIKTIENNYLELNFFDGNIIRLENQENKFQNVSDKIELEFGNGVTLNLKDKTFYINEKAKLELGQITIESDDNIEIKSTTTSKTKTTTTSKKTTIKKTTSPIKDLGSGNIENQDDTEKEVDDLSKQHIPTYSVTDMDVTSSTFRANVAITDDYSMLSGDSVVKIVNVSTGKKVYESAERLLTYNFSVECTTLEQDTNYILIISSEYIRDSKIYEKDFVQKTFRTEPIGLDVQKDYFTSNTLAFKFVESDFSDVTAVTATLKKGDKTSSLNFIRINGELKPIENENIFSFSKIDNENLEADTEYTLILSNFLFNDSNLSYGQNYVEKKFKTLKTSPKIGIPSYEIDKRNSQFVLKPGKIEDINEGINSYRYEIYKSSDCNIDGCFASPVKTIEKKNATTTNVKVVSSQNLEDNAIIRTNTYLYRIVVEFNDNEKIVEYASSLSGAMTLTGVTPPTLSFEQKYIKSEHIMGIITVVDESGTIQVAADGYTRFNISYTNSMGESKILTHEIDTVDKNNILTIPIDWNGLKSNDTYTVKVYADVDLKDGNLYKSYLVGSFTFNTPVPEPVAAFIGESDSEADKFSIPVQLKAITSDYSANISNKLVVNLYKGDLIDNNPLGTLVINDENPDEYESTIKGKIYDNMYVLVPDSFVDRNGNKLTNEEIVSGSNYTLEFKLTDYTDFQNEIPVTIAEGSNKFKASNVLIESSNPDNAVRAYAITNSQLGYGAYKMYSPKEDLNADTIVGYLVEADFDPSNDLAKELIYHVYKLNSNGEYEKMDDYDKVIDISDKSKELDSKYIYWLEDVSDENEFTRGFLYYFSYEVRKNNDELWPKDDVYRSHEVSPQKQIPRFNIYPKQSGINDETKLGYYKLKYNCIDVDKAIVENKIYYSCNSNICSNDIIPSSKEEYKEIELNNLSVGKLGIYYKQKLLGDIEEENLLNDLRFDNISTGFETIKFFVDKNSENFINNKSKLIFDLEVKEEQYNRIVNAKIKLTSGDEVFEKDKLPIEFVSSAQGKVKVRVSINLLDIIGFKNKEIIPELTLLYDTGNTGFNYLKKDYFAYQRIEDMYYFNGESYNVNASNSLFSIINKNEDIIDVEKYKKLDTTIYNGKNFEIPYEITEKGIYNSASNIYWTPKEIDFINIESNQEQKELKFNDIIPVISIPSENIIAGASNATINILYKGGAEQIYNNRLFIDYCEADEFGVINGSCYSTENDLASGILKDNKSVVSIRNLKKEQNYIFKVYYKKTKESDKVQLVDDEAQEIKTYYFKTISDIEMSAFNVEIIAESYSKKSLKISYLKSDLTGYDGIRYEVLNEDKTITYDTWVSTEIYDNNGNPLTNITTMRDLSKFKTPISAGGKYIIRITPYIGNEETGYEDLTSYEFKYNFKLLTSASFDVSYKVIDDKTDNNLVEFNIVCLDVSKTIKDEKYILEIYDLSTMDKVVEVSFDSKESVQSYIMKYETNTSYSLKIKYEENLTISGDATEKIISPLSDFTPAVVNVGQVSLNFIDDKVYLAFVNSSGLENVKSIVYTNYYQNNNGLISSTPNQTIENVTFITGDLYGKTAVMLELDKIAFPNNKSTNLVVVLLDNNNDEIGRINL